MDGKESTLIHYEEGINFILAFFVISYPDCVPLKHDVLHPQLCGISCVSKQSFPQPNISELEFTETLNSLGVCKDDSCVFMGFPEHLMC